MIKSFFIFLLTILLFLASLGYVVYRLQDPEFVISQARSVNLYGRLVGNVGQFIPSEELKSFGLTDTDVTDLLKSGFDGEQFYDLTGVALGAYLPWLTGQTDSLDYTYELGGVKQKLESATATKLSAKYYSLPLCTAAGLRNWSFENSLPSCQLASGTLQAKSITNSTNIAASKLTEGLPNTLSASHVSPSLAAAKVKVALGFKIIYAIWGATLLLGLLYLLIFRSSGFISLAICFFLVGLLQIAFSLVGWDWITKTTGDFVGGSGEAKSIAPIVIDLVSVILGAMKTVLGNISIGFLVSGVALLVLGIISKIHHSALVPKVAKS
ncbi:MAG: hypothetical protein Q8Q05_01990 [bacterium]|nr:hypothetical protein [bacterium]